MSDLSSQSNSDDSVNNSSNSIPIIPPRPKDKKKQSSESFDHVNSNESSQLLKEQDDLNNKPTNEFHEDIKQAGFSNESKTGGSQINTLTDGSLSDLDGMLNSQIDDQIFEDGDKTPGNSNTKVSFKDEINEELEGNDESSFNDDMETVLQEKEDFEIGNRANEMDVDNAERPVPVDITNQNDDYNSNSKLTESYNEQDNINDELHIKKNFDGISLTTRNKDTIDNTEYDQTNNQGYIASLAVDPIDKNEKATNHEENYTSANSESENIVNFQNSDSKIPKIPARPLKTKKNSESSNQSKSYSVEKPPSNVSFRQSKLNDNSDSSSPELNNSASPTIPVRPMKSSESNTEKSKPPPPKPKKLSSKIAAFQQQLFQPQIDKAQSSEKVTELNSKTIQPSHFKKFEGQGIPLPGMYNPQQLHTLGKVGRPEEIKSENNHTSATRRAKGPRGKRLPKAIQGSELENENRRKLEFGSLFSIHFKRCIKISDNSSNNSNDVSVEDNQLDGTNFDADDKVKYKSVEVLNSPTSSPVRVETGGQNFEGQNTKYYNLKYTEDNADEAFAKHEIDLNSTNENVQIKDKYETKSNETELNETEFNETEFNETELNETESNETELKETELNETESNETELNKTESNQTGEMGKNDAFDQSEIEDSGVTDVIESVHHV
ncbi:unnamed protein product [Candida verbasci]|uniref:Altered inheritance of mitochondria protein 21 n=1 Tax=Candida verbasci TaxID=1227364 RepID=A0A9W4XFP9_9ASCO|nr:unnamed protein product [Candida verbasci]